jgi:hypothetical protein
MDDLERQFESEMRALYGPMKRALGSSASSFLQLMVDIGALATAKSLINLDRPSIEFRELVGRGLGRLTVEALVTENSKWHPLFTDLEIARARRRLTDYRILALASP